MPINLTQEEDPISFPLLIMFSVRLTVQLLIWLKCSYYEFGKCGIDLSCYFEVPKVHMNFTLLSHFPLLFQSIPR